MSGSFLSQEEIDALLQQGDFGQPGNEGSFLNPEDLSEVEKDTLGEIGNISMGSAATALSQLLNQRVIITTPRVRVTTEEEFFASFDIPYMVIKVNFTSGMRGSNLLLVRISDALVMVDLMMGGDGTHAAAELSDLSISAVGEAMNQMMGSAATSMSSIFSRGVEISPPEVQAVEDPSQRNFDHLLHNGDHVVVVSFRMQIGELVDSEFVQVLPLPIAREQVEMLLAGGQEATDTGKVDQAPPSASEIAVPGVAPPMPVPAAMPAAPALNVAPRNIDLILDVPLSIQVILGRTRRPIKEVLNLAPGAIVDLEKLADEPVDVLVNGTLIAHGEVVVVNENFGVRLTSIVSPAERLQNLRNS